MAKDNSDVVTSSDKASQEMQEQIIKKQNEAMKEWLLNKAADKKDDIEKDLKAFLANEQNKDLKDKLLNDPDLKQKLSAAESKGFQELHKNGGFKPLDWEPSADNPEVKKKDVKNDKGELLCTLSEKTSKEKISVPGPDGREIEISSYRTIDFPPKLNDGTKGPLSVSMAVKDSKGANISEEKAVYFTAHYNEEGKLMGVCTPQPVKFIGNGDNAIGYIEKDGEIYTLPVTRGTYNKMMDEVVKNKGFGHDLSQTVEQKQPQAQDKVVMPANQTWQQDGILPPSPTKRAPKKTKQEEAAQEAQTATTTTTTKAIEFGASVTPKDTKTVETTETKTETRPRSNSEPTKNPSTEQTTTTGRPRSNSVPVTEQERVRSSIGNFRNKSPSDLSDKSSLTADHTPPVPGKGNQQNKGNQIQ
jgi:hypothetical protein